MDVAEVREELAKLCVNVFDERIPDVSDEIIFYDATAVTADAGDLIRARSVW